MHATHAGAMRGQFANLDLEKVRRSIKPGLLQLTCDQLRENTNNLERTSDVVEKHWAELPEPVRRAVRLAVYANLDERLRFRDVLRHPRQFSIAVVLAVQMVASGDSSAVVSFTNARNRFRNAVLDAIERENPELQARVSEALSDLPTSREGALTASQYMRWLRDVPDNQI